MVAADRGCSAVERGMEPPPRPADPTLMGRSVIPVCVLTFGTIASFIPTLWGASGLGLTSLAFGAIGSVAGVFVGVRLQSV